MSQHASTKINGTQRRLIEKAYTLFQTPGYENVDVCDIAHAANDAPGTFYYYFRSKQDILCRYFSLNDQYLGQELQKLSDLSENICVGLTNFFARVLGELIQKDGKQFTLDRMQRLQLKSPLSSQLYRTLCTVVEHAQQNGELRTTYSPDRIVSQLLIVFRGATYEWCTESDTVSPHHLYHESISLALKAFQ